MRFARDDVIAGTRETHSQMIGMSATASQAIVREAGKTLGGGCGRMGTPTSAFVQPIPTRVSHAPPAVSRSKRPHLTPADWPSPSRSARLLSCIAFPAGERPTGRNMLPDDDVWHSNQRLEAAYGAAAMRRHSEWQGITRCRSWATAPGGALTRKRVQLRLSVKPRPLAAPPGRLACRRLLN
jgi:hypothetical protein